MPPKKTRKEPVIPKARDYTRTALVAPSREVEMNIGNAELIVGIDIETHDYEDIKSGLKKGQFGFFHLSDPCVFKQRIVQISWAIGGVDGDATALEEFEEYVVRPEGFAISEKATKKHSITHERALREGLPLRDVLERFMQAMARVEERQGRIGSHNFEFDAGIIMQELENANLHHWRRQWFDMAAKGFCTMDPAIGEWVQHCHGRDRTKDEDGKQVLGLDTLVSLLLPKVGATKTLLDKRHSAGADAQLHRLVFIAMMRMCARACVVNTRHIA